MNEDVSSDVRVDRELRLPDSNHTGRLMLHECDFRLRTQSVHRQRSMPIRYRGAQAQNRRLLSRPELGRCPYPWREARNGGKAASKEPFDEGNRGGRFRELVFARRAAHQVAQRAQGTPVGAQRVGLLELEAAHRARQIVWSHRPTWFRIPPTNKAKGKMKATIPAATALPCSLAMIRSVAKHGMNSVMVTIATRIW